MKITKKEADPQIQKTNQWLPVEKKGGGKIQG